MNECFLFVERVSNIDFRFIINRKEKSMVKIKAKLLNNSEIELFVYDDLADYIYKEHLESFFVRGSIRENMQIEIREIYKFKYLD